MVRVWALILATSLLIPGFALAQRDSLWVSGKLKSGTDKTAKRVILSFTDHKGKNHAYNADLQEDAFKLRVPIQESVVDANLRVSGENQTNIGLQYPLNLFVHSDDISVQGQTEELDLAIVSGGIENDDFNALRQSTADLNRKMTALYAPLLKDKTASTGKSEAIFKEIAALSQLQTDAQKQFIVSHPNSYVSLFLLYRMKNMFTSDDYATAFKSLDSNFRKTTMGAKIQQNLDKESVTAKGFAAINFERTTIDGKYFKLSDLKGRVFILDFWGSWCGPCRASMPHLKELHERYKNKGFEIVGVAHERGKTLDECKISWGKAIDELGIHWTNVLNNENKDQFDIVKAYNISAFPTKILIDEQGKVILRVSASATDDIDVALKKIYGF